jgi:hypothetical protein
MPEPQIRAIKHIFSLQQFGQHPTEKQQSLDKSSAV